MTTIDINNLICEEITVWYVAQEDQGQIVEVAYAVAGESELLVQRQHDGSDGEVVYFVAGLGDVIGELDLINRAPRVRDGAWRRVSSLVDEIMDCLQVAQREGYTGALDDYKLTEADEAWIIRVLGHTPEDEEWQPAQREAVRRLSSVES